MASSSASRPCRRDARTSSPGNVPRARATREGMVSEIRRTTVPSPDGDLVDVPACAEQGRHGHGGKHRLRRERAEVRSRRGRYGRCSWSRRANDGERVAGRLTCAHRGAWWLRWRLGGLRGKGGERQSRTDRWLELREQFRNVRRLGNGEQLGIRREQHRVLRQLRIHERFGRRQRQLWLVGCLEFIGQLWFVNELRLLGQLRAPGVLERRGLRGQRVPGHTGLWAEPDRRHRPRRDVRVLDERPRRDGHESFNRWWRARHPRFRATFSGRDCRGLRQCLLDCRRQLVARHHWRWHGSDARHGR